jgi:hypothetical protein
MIIIALSAVLVAVGMGIALAAPLLALHFESEDRAKSNAQDALSTSA